MLAVQSEILVPEADNNIYLQFMENGLSLYPTLTRCNTEKMPRHFKMKYKDILQQTQ